MWGNSRTRIAVTAVAIGAAASAVQGQESGITTDLTLTTTATIDTNPGLAAVSPGTVFSLAENLGFAFRAETASQLFEITGGAELSFSQTLGGGNSTSFTTPALSLRYSREAANSNLELRGSFWSGDVSSVFDADPGEAVSLIVDTGTLARSRASLSYNLGVNAPLGFSITGSLDARDYTGTTDPALFDRSTRELGIAANMRLSPSTQGVLGVARTDYRSSDALSTASETLEYSFGVVHEISTALTIGANVGFREVSTTAGGPPVVTQGLYGGFDFTQELVNGSVFGELEVDDSGGTPSSSLTFGRSMELPNGSLSASLTADWSPGSAVQLLGSAEIMRELPDGAVSFNLSQSLTTDSLNQDIKQTSVTLDYQQALNSESGINLTLNLSRSEDGGAGAADTLNRATFTASYSQELTPDWGLSVGISRRQNTGSAIAPAVSDSLFLTLTRDLQFGF